MDVPIRNHGAAPLTLFIEPFCEAYDIPAGGEAVVTLQDGRAYSLDVYPGGQMSFWVEEAGSLCPKVEIFSTPVSSNPRPGRDRA